MIRLDSEIFNPEYQTLLSTLIQDVHSIIHYYHNYLAEDKYRLISEEPVLIKFTSISNRTLNEFKYSAKSITKVCVLGFIAGIIRNNNMFWIKIGDNPHLKKQEYPTIKDGWGLLGGKLIKGDTDWANKQLRDIGIFKIPDYCEVSNTNESQEQTIDVSILIEFHDGKTWEFSGLPVS